MTGSRSTLFTNESTGWMSARESFSVNILTFPATTFYLFLIGFLPRKTCRSSTSFSYNRFGRENKPGNDEKQHIFDENVRFVGDHVWQQQRLYYLITVRWICIRSRLRFETSDHEETCAVSHQHLQSSFIFSQSDFFFALSINFERYKKSLTWVNKFIFRLSLTLGFGIISHTRHMSRFFPLHCLLNYLWWFMMER